MGNQPIHNSYILRYAQVTLSRLPRGTLTNPDRGKNPQWHCSSLQFALLRQKNLCSSQRSLEFEQQRMFWNSQNCRCAMVNNNDLPTYAVRCLEFVLIRSSLLLFVAIGSLRPNDAYMRCQPRPSLVQIMACRLASNMPLSESMLEYC